jgi:polysaccharide biosynthesis transport protein
MSTKTEEGEILCGRRSTTSRCKIALWLILGGVALVAVVAVVWSGLLEPRSYTADAYVRCAIQQDRYLEKNPPAPTELEFEIFKNTQMSLMTNRMVLSAALHRETKVGDEKFVIAKFPILADQNDPVNWLIKHLSISFPRKDEIMKVSVTTSDPVQSAAIVNAVRDAYFSEVVDAGRRECEERISELKGIQIGKMQEVKDAMSDLRKMADSLGTSDTDTLNQKQKTILDELANIRAESVRNQFEYNRMMSQLAARKADRDAVENQPISDIECQQYGAFDVVLKKLGEALADREIAADAKDQAQSDSLKKKYSERIEQIREEIKRKSLADTEREIKKIEAAIEIAKKQNEVAQEELRQLRKEADRIGLSSIDMQMRRAAIVNSQKSLDNITAELDKLMIESKAAPRVTRYGGDAEPPKE